MRKFAVFVKNLGKALSYEKKFNLLRTYFSEAESQDVMAGILLLWGKGPKQPVKVGVVKGWVCQEAKIPHWLFERCLDVSGDFSETVTLLLPSAVGSSPIGLSRWCDSIEALADKSEDVQRMSVVNAWKDLDDTQRYGYMKILIGEVSSLCPREVLIRAMSLHFRIPEIELKRILKKKGRSFKENLRTLVSQT